MGERRALLFGGLGLAVVLVGSGCGQSTIAADELASIVRRDGVPLDDGGTPERMVDLLDDYDVVIIGETHLVVEQRVFTASVLRELHDRGFRQLLLEWPHLADWLADDYVTAGGLDPGYRPPTWLYGDLLGDVREFNQTLPPEQRIHVRGIDVNLDNYGGAAAFQASLRGFARNLDGTGAIDELLAADYASADEQTTSLEAALARLVAESDALRARWSDRHFGTVREMLEVELASVAIRAAESDDESARRREPEMMRIADLRLAEAEGKSVVNVGGNHAQKERLRGTDHEWIGDYLVHRSPEAGSVISIIVVPAQVRSPDLVVDYEIADASPDNELLWLMSQAWPDTTVFLPLDDPVFARGGVPINIEGRVKVGALQRHWDAVVLLPVATRIPLP